MVIMSFKLNKKWIAVAAFAVALIVIVTAFLIAGSNERKIGEPQTPEISQGDGQSASTPETQGAPEGSTPEEGNKDNAQNSGTTQNGETENGATNQNTEPPKEEKPEPAITSIKDADEMKKLIAQKGLKINGSCSVKEVIIPAEFDSVYSTYNDLQKEQGNDLSKYKGKRVKLWSALLSEYPDHAEGTVRINVLTYKNKIIGGDISSVELGGFMKALEK